jgi:hypothetical protein
METIFLIMPKYKLVWNDICQFLHLPLWFCMSGKTITQEQFAEMSPKEKNTVIRIDITGLENGGFRIGVIR